MVQDQEEDQREPDGVRIFVAEKWVDSVVSVDFQVCRKGLSST